MSAKSANVQANAICPKISFFFIGMGICYFSNKPFCTFGQIVATLDCPVRSSYPQLHGIVNLIQILQGGLEIVLLSWRTFLLTDLHSAVHLCTCWLNMRNIQKLDRVGPADNRPSTD